MGNTGSGSRERHKSGDLLAGPISPGKDAPPTVFDFTMKAKLIYQGSLESGDECKEGEGGPGSRCTTPPINTGLSQLDEKALPTVFKWDGGGKQVFISGTFTNWKSVPMVRSHGDFVTIMDLPEGEHQYRFCVDGQWMHDPTEPTSESGIGVKNNVISVRKADFEVFEALAVDSVSSPTAQVFNSGSPPGGYTQDIPEKKPMEKAPSPPILPPHLLQVILNKDVPVSCEPTLLPEPNHVMLNHLYALSIKDGVMVLSATHRYRKKYVTTLLYKPI